MNARRHIVATGAALGVAVAAYFWTWQNHELASGTNAASVGFGLSIALFLLSLPWSLAVWALMIAIATATGADGPAFITPFLFAMPIVAGIAWGWVASFALRRWKQ